MIYELGAIHICFATKKQQIQLKSRAVFFILLILVENHRNCSSGALLFNWKGCIILEIQIHVELQRTLVSLAFTSGPWVLDQPIVEMTVLS